MTTRITTEQLTAMLTMREAGEDPRGVLLTAPDQREPADRVFGGLLLGQAVAAAGATCRPGLHPLALAADFVAAVPTTGENAWLVETLGDAPALASRRCSVLGDDGGTLFTATVRLGAVRDDLPSYSEKAPWEAAPPEGLPGLAERFGDDDRVPTWWSMRRPVDIRHAEPPGYVETVGPPRATQTVWWRPDGPVAPDPLTSAAVIAYTSDMSVVEPVFSRMGSARHRGPSRILSLTHQVTFHATPPLSDWVQYDCRVDTLAHGRAQGTGDMFTRDGTHVADVAQLALVKFG